MAANKQQGSYFGLFLVGATVLCAGFAYFDSGFGKALLALGAIVFIGSLFGFMGIKPLEGKTALKPGSRRNEIAWRRRLCARLAPHLSGIHITDSTGGRIVFALLGIAVTLVGIIYILPAAFNKNAVWKGEQDPSSQHAAAKTTMEHSR